jgi:sporulation protein YlmC with PRC-barrel domain
MLMATVAAFALATPVVAQDQTKPQVQDTMQPTTGSENAPAMTEGQPVDQSAGQEMAAEEAKPPADMKFIEAQEEQQLLAYDEVIGTEVVNVNDEEVGEIADLVMDPDQKLVGVVLSVGGFLGMGDKWVAVPVDQIQFPTADQPARLRVAVTADQLENAPDFTTKEAIAAREAAVQAQQEAAKQQVPPPATTAQ